MSMDIKYRLAQGRTHCDDRDGAFRSAQGGEHS